MSRTVYLLLLLLAQWLAQSSCSAPPDPVEPADDANERMLQLAEHHAARVLAIAPEWASQLGAADTLAGTGYNRRLTRFDSAGRAQQIALIESLQAELLSVDRAALDGTAAVTWDILRNAYDLAVRDNRLNTGLPSWLGVAPPYVIDQLFGPHIDLPRTLITAHRIRTRDDAEAFLARLAGIDRALDDVVLALQEDADRGVIPPRFALAGIAASAARFPTDRADEHPIARAFAAKLDAVDALEPTQRKTLQQRAQTLLKQRVFPAYTRLGDAATALTARSPAGAGIWRLPEGAKIYQIALEAYGAGNRSAEAVHQLGLSEVARIHKEMDVILKRLGYREGSIANRLRALSRAPGMQIEDSAAGRAEIIETMNGYVADVLALAPQWFGTLPDATIEVKRIPVYEQDAASGAYYLAPSLDGTRPGAMMINLKDTADWPRYTLPSLVYHEAVPGHHFQVSIKQSIPNMPTLRNMMFFSEFGEGWALYAEALAQEMGLYDDDPYGDLGRLRAEVYRATRLVVDTGLHHKRWSRERAIDWMIEATGETRPAVTREIERYAVWPGQATSYKLGMIKFQELRAQAEVALGSRFSISAFHDQVLAAGSMPMPVLEARVNAWIAAQLRPAP
ncbi:MAG: DUF885 domain-containing protein [Pseudomonadota bacterium]